MAHLDQSAAAMAAAVAELRRQQDAIEAMFADAARMPKEQNERHDQLTDQMYELSEKIAEAPVASFADALAVMLATNNRILADVGCDSYPTADAMPNVLALRRASDFLARYMGTDLDALGAKYFRSGDYLWDRGRGLRAEWWVERALASGFSFNACSDGTVTICAPVDADATDLCEELPALDRESINWKVRFLIASQRDPKQCDMKSLAGKEWWLTSMSTMSLARDDLRVVCGAVLA